MFLSKRRGVYYLFLTDESGKRLSRSTHARTKPDAVQFLRLFDAEREKQRRALKPVSLSTFQASFLEFSRSIHTRKTVEANLTAFRMFSAFMGADVALHSITPADCERFLAERTAEASAWTARKYRLALRAAFERAKSWGHVLENPWVKVKNPKTPETLPAYFTREQFRALLAVIENRDMRELVTLAALTGLRQGELLAMRWEWVDLERRVLTVTNSEHFTTKSKRVRVVPLCDEARTVLLSLNERAKDSGLVFRLEADRVTHTFKKAVRRAGLPEALHFHSLRHTFASWLVQGGVSLYQVSRLLGHSSTAVTEQYAHLVPSDMHGILAPLHFSGPENRGGTQVNTHTPTGGL
jgi:integrase